MRYQMFFDPMLDENGKEVVCSVLGCLHTATIPEDDIDEELCPRHLEEFYDEWMDDVKIELALEERARDEYYTRHFYRTTK